MNDKEEVIRIDMYQMPESLGSCVRVFKFPSKFDPDMPLSSPRSIPASKSDNYDMTLDEMVTWLQEHGWKVRRWNGGARAWKYEVFPIRTRAQIFKLRDRLSLYPPKELAGVVHTLDLAYDY